MECLESMGISSSAIDIIIYQNLSIDSDYQGQVFVCLENKGKTNFEILPGDKIAQGVLIPVVRMDFDVVDEFHKETERNTGGFGSTGR